MRRFYTILSIPPIHVGGRRIREAEHSEIGQYLTEKEIIQEAELVCQQHDTTLVDVAGIGWWAMGDGPKRAAMPMRAFERGEELSAAIKMLNTNLNYEIFDSAKPREVERFIERARKLGLTRTAMDLLETTRHAV
jgi:hypothetical protein